MAHPVFQDQSCVSEPLIEHAVSQNELRVLKLKEFIDQYVDLDPEEWLIHTHHLERKQSSGLDIVGPPHFSKLL